MKVMHREDGATLQNIYLVVFSGLAELHYEGFWVQTGCDELVYQIICQNPSQLGPDLLTDTNLLV